MSKTISARLDAIEKILLAGDNVPVDDTDYDGAVEMLDEWIESPERNFTLAPPNQLQQKLDTCNTAITVVINRLSALYGLPEQSQIDTVDSVITELKEARDD